jgi:hypothetical protein
MSIASRRPGVRTARLRLSRLALPAGILTMASLAVLAFSDLYAPQAPVDIAAAPKPQVQSRPAPQAHAYHPLLDPAYSLGAPAQKLSRALPRDPGFRIADLPRAPEPSTPEPSALEAPVVAALPEPQALPLPPTSLDRPRIVEDAPRPVPRPSDLIRPRAPEPPRNAEAPRAPEQPRAAEKPVQRRSRTAAAPQPTPEDNRNFFEKLFGVQRQPTTALAYAAPQDDIVDSGRGRRLSPVAPAPVSTAHATAVYDISARTVYMPNGERLEAHSGLGEYKNDPRYVHLRMRGATPPHTYTLSMREAPFHGVRALRLNPVGGARAIHGRTGLLTHTYLLGPGGDSNGCISFKDYDRFLQAYLRGEVKRVVVVAGNG